MVELDSLSFLRLFVSFTGYYSARTGHSPSCRVRCVKKIRNDLVSIRTKLRPLKECDESESLKKEDE